MSHQEDAGHIFPLSQGLGAEGLPSPPLFYSVTGKEGTARALSLVWPSSGWGLSAAGTSMLKLSVQATTGTSIIGLTFIYIILFNSQNFRTQVLLIFISENTKAQRGEVNLSKIIYLRSSGAGIQTPVVLPISSTMFITGETPVMIRHKCIINFTFAFWEAGGGTCLTFWLLAPLTHTLPGGRRNDLR